MSAHGGDRQRIRLGTAGWTVPRESDPVFAGPGTHLERYGRGLDCVEINSSFYRSHRASTWSRWAESVPDGFRFAVKAPRALTHTAKLARPGALLAEFVAQVAPLGAKLGPLLFQLPPRLAFDAGVAEEFFATLREVHAGAAVVEPRHPTWFTAEAAHLLRRFEAARAAADPACVAEAANPGGWAGLRYFRLHGSPRTYYSSYPRPALELLAAELRKHQDTGAEVWCIFDNTALGAATGNAREVDGLLNRATPG